MEEKDKLELTTNEDSTDLRKESADITKAITEATTVEKQKDLTYLFNINQQKKTVVRQNSLSDLQDKLVSEAVGRLTAHPEEIETKQLFDGMKTVQDIMERNQAMINGQEEKIDTLIQVSKDTNITINGSNPEDAVEGLNKESRQKIQAAIAAYMNSVKSLDNSNSDTSTQNQEVIDVTPESEDNHHE